MIQCKVIEPADLADVDILAERLAAFEARCNVTARPFDWPFTRADLVGLCRRIDGHRVGARPLWRPERRMTRARPTPPTSTKTSLGQRLTAHARHRWPALARIEIRFRGNFAYVDGHLTDGEILPLCRLRYGGSASLWGFAIYRASHDDYQDSFLPSGQPARNPEEALDCACGLCLNDPTGWS